MSLGTWIKSLIRIAPKRDVSRLSSPPAPGSAPPAADVIEEAIDTSGRPLKEHHRRRALRDKRLLPKALSPARSLGLAKKQNVMSSHAATRLFAGTMRTRNRNVRDLATDEEQLRRFRLPIWRSEADVASALGISLAELWFFSMHRERERQPHYVTFSIPKRSGGKRLILAPKRRLKAIQRKLLKLVVEQLPVSEQAHAFRCGRNIRTGAEPHAGKAAILKLDMKDFFPSVTAARVRGLLIAYGYSYPVATTLAVLMTEAERQPVEWNGEIVHVPVGPRHCVQGAPTSPGICNAMLLRLDRRLAGIARKHGLAFTRYADDLTVSGNLTRDRAHQIRNLVEHVVNAEGFQINRDKTRLMLRGGRQTVTGVVVNHDIGLSRQVRRRLRAAFHQLNRLDPQQQALRRRELEGKLAFLAMLNPKQAAQLK